MDCISQLRQSRSAGRGARAAGFFLISVTALTLAAAMLLGHSQAAAQAAGGQGQGTAAAAVAPAGNAQHGKSVYNRIGCWECHGYDGQGGGGATGPRVGPNPMPWGAFSGQVRTPRNDMPPYSAKVLSDADLADIYAFLKSVPQPPRAETIELLK